MKITERLRIYAKKYREAPFGREVEGTVELLEEAAEYIEILNNEAAKYRVRKVDYRKRVKKLKKAAKPLIDYLYKHGTPHDAIIVKMDAVEHLSGETASPIEIRD